jgi:hypothetical protein
MADQRAMNLRNVRVRKSVPARLGGGLEAGGFDRLSPSLDQNVDPIQSNEADDTAARDRFAAIDRHV